MASTIEIDLVCSYGTADVVRTIRLPKGTDISVLLEKFHLKAIASCESVSCSNPFMSESFLGEYVKSGLLENGRLYRANTPDVLKTLRALDAHDNFPPL